MASTAYRVRFRLAVEDEERRSLYEHLASIVTHLEGLRVRLESIVVDAVTRNVTVTLSNPISPAQADHLGLVAA